MLGGSEKHMEIPNYAISRSLTNNWIKEKKINVKVFPIQVNVSTGNIPYILLILGYTYQYKSVYWNNRSYTP